MIVSPPEPLFVLVPMTRFDVLYSLCLVFIVQFSFSQYCYSLVPSCLFISLFFSDLLSFGLNYNFFSYLILSMLGSTPRTSHPASDSTEDDELSTTSVKLREDMIYTVDILCCEWCIGRQSPTSCRYFFLVDGLQSLVQLSCCCGQKYRVVLALQPTCSSPITFLAGLQSEDKEWRAQLALPCVNWRVRRAPLPPSVPGLAYFAHAANLLVVPQNCVLLWNLVL